HRPDEAAAADAVPAPGDLQAAVGRPLEAVKLEAQGRRRVRGPSHPRAAHGTPAALVIRRMARVAVDLSVLKESRNLRLLILGELFSGLGTQAALVAIPYQVFLLTHQAALVGLLGIVELIPIVGGSLLGGAIADRVDDRRRLMVGGRVLVAIGAP